MLKQSFHKIDSNQDGTLTLDELKNGLGQLCMFEILQSHADTHKTWTEGDENEDDTYVHIMNSVDLDGDGKIDYLEFIQATINHKALLNKENIQSIFNMFDKDGDGEISMEELNAVFGADGIPTDNQST